MSRLSDKAAEAEPAPTTLVPPPEPNWEVLFGRIVVTVKVNSSHPFAFSYKSRTQEAGCGPNQPTCCGIESASWFIADWICVTIFWSNG